MGKNLLPKIVVIIVLVVLAGWTLYPPDKTLKPGIDLAGGTSLIYEIDIQDLEEGEEKDLAQRMITVLRRRIDPANIQNLIWRPQGNTRFEIQMGGRESLEHYVANAIPMGRFGTVDEIADAIVYLASDRSSFMTGHALVVDSGESI